MSHTFLLCLLSALRIVYRLPTAIGTSIAILEGRAWRNWPLVALERGDTMRTFDPSRFTVAKARPLPVFLLLDVSGSMAGRKIATLNQAAKEMLGTFAKEDETQSQIQMSIITFGGKARLHAPPTPSSQIEWTELIADGGTPMGAAITMAKGMVEDKEATPSRAYRPTVILVSDGQPTDDWREPLRSFVSDGRSAKCDRMAMAIGSDADEAVLSEFIKGTPHELFHAGNASQIHEFFKRVTMSVTVRSRSTSPNDVPAEAVVGPDGPSAPTGSPTSRGRSGDAGSDGYEW